VEVLHLPSTTKLEDVIWNPIQTEVEFLSPMHGADN
jgi:hypothetical protein